MTDAQQLALRQLEAIAALSKGAFVVLEHTLLEEGVLVVRIRVDCSSIEHAPRGLRLEPTEEFVLALDRGYPFHHPTVDVPHERWAGTPHVQWRHRLCLYRAPRIQWDPADGMPGFIQQLWDWLVATAADKLDPVGAPLHPPVAYTGTPIVVVPRADAPVVDKYAWRGVAELRWKDSRRADIVGWVPEDQRDNWHASCAPAILLPRSFACEYPKTLGALLWEFLRQGENRETVKRLFIEAFHHWRKDPPVHPLLFIVGTNARGLVGGQMLQHLAAWSVLESDVQPLVERLHTDDTWTDTRLNWCRALEARPQVTQRRDDASPLEWIRGKAVTLWGCGALGATIAEQLARAGVRRLVLRDSGMVTPGLLVRQPFTDGELGEDKVVVLAQRLMAIRPDLELLHDRSDMLGGDAFDDDWTDGADVVIDTTGTNSLATKAELLRRKRPRRAVLASLMIGPRAERGLAAWTGSDASAATRDAVRSAKLAICGSPALAGAADDFWPAQVDLFEPEPGCSEPTFRGSATEVAALGSLLLLSLARSLGAEAPALRAARVVSLIPDDPAHNVSWHWPADQTITNKDGTYDVRIDPDLLQRIMEEVERAETASGRRRAAETGGLLFGERDDAAGVIWITKASGPPTDSKCSPTSFICGTAGMRDLNDEYAAHSRGSVCFIGMWHTHPTGGSGPSDTDTTTMRTLVEAAGESPAVSVLLIVAGTSASPTLGCHLFTREDLQSGRVPSGMTPEAADAG